MENKNNTAKAFLVAFDEAHGEDLAVLSIPKLHNGHITYVSTIYGTEAKERYERLTKGEQLR